MKYRVTRAWEGVQWGAVLIADEKGQLHYEAHGLRHVIRPHEIALMISAGCIERLEAWHERPVRKWG